MLALKLLLTVAGALLLATALAIPLFTVVTRILRARKAAREGTPEPLVELAEIPWRGPLALAMVACLPLLIAASIVVVPAGMGAIRISQISGTQPGTLYPGVHFITPLVESVEMFDLRDHLFTAGIVEGANRTPQKNGLKVQSREGLNIGLAITVRYRL